VYILYTSAGKYVGQGTPNCGSPPRVYLPAQKVLVYPSSEKAYN